MKVFTFFVSFCVLFTFVVRSSVAASPCQTLLEKDNWVGETIQIDQAAIEIVKEGVISEWRDVEMKHISDITAHVNKRKLNTKKIGAFRGTLLAMLAVTQGINIVSPKEYQILISEIGRAFFEWVPFLGTGAEVTQRLIGATLFFLIVHYVSSLKEKRIEVEKLSHHVDLLRENQLQQLRFAHARLIKGLPSRFYEGMREEISRDLKGEHPMLSERDPVSRFSIMFNRWVSNEIDGAEFMSHLINTQEGREWLRIYAEVGKELVSLTDQVIDSGNHSKRNIISSEEREDLNAIFSVDQSMRILSLNPPPLSETNE